MEEQEKIELKKEHLLEDVENCSLYVDENTDMLSGGNCLLWGYSCGILTDSSCYPMLNMAGCDK